MALVVMVLCAELVLGHSLVPCNAMQCSTHSFLANVTLRVSHLSKERLELNPKDGSLLCMVISHPIHLPSMPQQVQIHTLQ